MPAAHLKHAELPSTYRARPLIPHVSRLQAPDADGAFKRVLLDEEGVVNKTGARLFTSKSAFIEELRRQGEPVDGLKLVGEGCRVNQKDEIAGEQEDSAPAAAVVG